MAKPEKISCRDDRQAGAISELTNGVSVSPQMKEAGALMLFRLEDSELSLPEVADLLFREMVKVFLSPGHQQSTKEKD
jgi:hypothetical protein